MRKDCKHCGSLLPEKATKRGRPRSVCNECQYKRQLRHARQWWQRHRSKNREMG